MASAFTGQALSIPVGAASVVAGASASAPSTSTVASAQDEVAVHADERAAPGEPGAVETDVAAGEPIETFQSSSRPNALDAKRFATTLARALDPLPPVRLHVEWSGASARVWIGLDVPAASHLPALVANLARWMDRAGTRLRSVTCNGCVCFASEPGAPTGSLVASASRPEAAKTQPTIVDVIVEKET